MVEKYGLPLTDADWAGLPVRLGQFGDLGAVEDLQGECDAVLLWSGATTEVVIDSSCAHSDKVTRTTFTRHSGMLDVLPQGTKLHQVRWRGGASTCVSVNLPRHKLALMGETMGSLSADMGPRFGVMDEHASDLIRRIQTQAADGLTLGPAYVQGLSLAFAAYVSQRYGATGLASSPPVHALSAHKQRVLVAFIEDQLSSAISLSEMAASVGYSPDHFAKLFKRSFGMPPYQYLVSRRIARAKQLLLRSELTLAQIAAECGFASQAHFTDVFRRFVSLTPGAFRKCR